MYRHETAEFKIESGSIQATDPCYKTGTWCAFKIDNVLNGTWTFEVIEDIDSHIEQLSAFNKNTSISTASSAWELIGFGGVDSGQFGFFDYKYFKDHESEREFGEPGFYNSACEQTLHPYDWRPIPENKTFKTIEEKYTDWMNAGIVEEFGCVASSGYGDGSYPIYVQKDKDGKVIAVRVKFIIDDEFEDEEF